MSDAPQERRIEIVIDQLPWLGTPPFAETAAQGVERIAAVLRVHDALAVGGTGCESSSAGGADLETVLEVWRSWGLPLLPAAGLPPDCTDAAPSPPGLLEHVAAYDRALARRDGESRLRLARALVAAVRSVLSGAIDSREEASSLRLRLPASNLVADHLDLLLLELAADGWRFAPPLTGATPSGATAFRVGADLTASVGVALAAFQQAEVPPGGQAAGKPSSQAPAPPRGEEPGGSPAKGATASGVSVRWLDPELGAAQRQALASAIDHAADSERMRGFLVMHRGRLLAEAYFHGADASTPQNLKSGTKSLIAALVGVALRQGAIAGLDEPLSRLLPDRFAAGRHADKAGVTLRQLLAMTSGLPAVDYGAFQASQDWIEALLAPAVRGAPGGLAHYDTPVVHLLSAVLREATGRSPRELADQALLAPWGGRVFSWRRDPDGLELGGNDAFLLPRDFLQLGELYRLGGRHDGHQVLDEAFVRESIRRQAGLPEPTINHGTLPSRGYGLLWWLLDLGHEDAFAALGHGGQELIVFPSRELVVLLTSRWPGPSSGEHYRHLARVLDEGVLPAFGRAGGGAGLEGAR